jgi:hypothetical protein
MSHLHPGPDDVELTVTQLTLSCLVCAHHSRAVIDAALRRPGAHLREVADHFGLRFSDLSKHRRFCSPPWLQPSGLRRRLKRERLARRNKVVK